MRLPHPGEAVVAQVELREAGALEEERDRLEHNDADGERLEPEPVEPFGAQGLEDLECGRLAELVVADVERLERLALGEGADEDVRLLVRDLARSPPFSARYYRYPVKQSSTHHSAFLPQT